MRNTLLLSAGAAGSVAVATAGHHPHHPHYRRTLIRDGHVVTMDPALGNLPKGDVLIEDDKIIAVGEICRSRALM